MFSMPRPRDNPPNPYASTEMEYLHTPPPADLRVHEEVTKSALNRNQSPDVGFEWSVNPYRGCFHACSYCYARPTHQYLGLGAGTDFDREIVVKVNIAERLERELRRDRTAGAPIAFSGNTDCYQPLEARYGLTRACLEACRRYANPVGIVTKSTLIERDIDLLCRLDHAAQSAGAAPSRIWMSIPFANDAVAKAIEANAPPPQKRLRTLAALSRAGLRTGVLFAPVIPGLNDHAIPEVLARAKEAGASMASMVLLRLPAEVRPVFLKRLREAFPLRAGKVESSIRACRDGALNRADFGARMRGAGPRWQLIESLFRTHARKLGFEAEPPRVHRVPVTASTPGSPRRDRRQLELFS